MGFITPLFWRVQSLILRVPSLPDRSRGYNSTYRGHITPACSCKREARMMHRDFRHRDIAPWGGMYQLAYWKRKPTSKSKWRPRSELKSVFAQEVLWPRARRCLRTYRWGSLEANLKPPSISRPLRIHGHARHPVIRPNHIFKEKAKRKHVCSRCPLVDEHSRVILCTIPLTGL